MVDFSLIERPNYLRLYGAPYTLDVPASPTLILRKQTRPFLTWETQLSFRPTSPYTEAGTVVFWNNFVYSSIGIRLSSTNNETKRIIRFRPAEGPIVEKQLQNEDSNVIFVIECSHVYRFGFRESHCPRDGIQWLGEVSNSTMTRDPPVGAAFTGMMLGLYAFGEFQPCLVPADFKYAEFR